jgi:GAF domain-containing protein
MRTLIEQIISVFDARAVIARLVSPDGDELLAAESHGISQDYLRKGPVRISASPIDQRVVAGEVVTVADVSRDPGFAYPREAAAEGLRGLVACPMSLRGWVICVLHIYLDDVEKLSPEDMSLLRILTDMGALALEKARLHNSLYRIAEALNSSLELGPMLQRVLEVTVDKMRLKGGSIRLWSNKDQILHLVASYGLTASYLDKGAVQASRSPMDQRVLRGETVVLYDVVTEPGLQYPEEARREGIRSVLAVPLRLKDRPLGVMRVYSARAHHFNPVDTRFLGYVADLVALAIENAELYAALSVKYENLKVDLADWYQFLALG